ncbi:MAG: hypothetical protein HYR60_19840 [Acidobacteria bacterium]|nr:hypothetical protein [Acidobacteriota bacterium]MBI3473878.1 hypothetical protein [Candidatus Solibacter usitatus]
MRKVLLLLATALALDAQTWHRFGNTLFQLPEGWTHINRRGTAILTAPEPRGAPTVTILLSPSATLSSLDFKVVFEQVVTKANGLIKVVGGGKTEPRQSSEGYPVLVRDLHAVDGRGGWAYRFYMGSKPGDRFEFLTYMTSSEELYRKYLPVLESICGTMTFVNLGAAKK